MEIGAFQTSQAIFKEIEHGVKVPSIQNIHFTEKLYNKKVIFLGQRNIRIVSPDEKRWQHNGGIQHQIFS